MPEYQNGYAIYWFNKYCVTLSTGGREDGTNDVFINCVGGNTHEHLWFHLNNNQIINGGNRLKDNGTHMSPSFNYDINSTEAVAKIKFNLNPENGNVSCQLTDISHKIEEYTALPTYAREKSKRNIKRFDLPFSSSEIQSEFCISLFDINSYERIPINDNNNLTVKFDGNDKIGLIIYRNA